MEYSVDVKSASSKLTSEGSFFNGFLVCMYDLPTDENEILKLLKIIISESLCSFQVHWCLLYETGKLHSNYSVYVFMIVVSFQWIFTNM